MSTKRQQQPPLLPYDGPYVRAFEVLRELEAWPLSREQVTHDRLERNAVDPRIAEQAAFALKSKYDPRKHKDLPATLCYWALIEAGRSGRNGTGSAARPAMRMADDDPRPDGWESLDRQYRRRDGMVAEPGIDPRTGRPLAVPGLPRPSLGEA